jgi:hypothetical protein
LPSCSAMTTVFLLAVGCAIMGQIAAALAWRQRRPELEKWRWLTDPTILFRASFYQQPPPALRQALGIAWLTFHLISAQQSGATQVCGLSF